MIYAITIKVEGQKPHKTTVQAETPQRACRIALRQYPHPTTGKIVRFYDHRGKELFTD